MRRAVRLLVLLLASAATAAAAAAAAPACGANGTSIEMRSGCWCKPGFYSMAATAGSEPLPCVACPTPLDDADSARKISTKGGQTHSASSQWLRAWRTAQVHCPGGPAGAALMLPKPGVWLQRRRKGAQLLATPMQCFDQFKCPGVADTDAVALLSALWVNASSSREQARTLFHAPEFGCLPKHQGRLCSSCVAGHSLVRGVCQPCTDAAAWESVQMYSAGIAAFAAYVLWHTQLQHHMSLERLTFDLHCTFFLIQIGFGLISAPASIARNMFGTNFMLFLAPTRANMCWFTADWAAEFLTILLYPTVAFITIVAFASFVAIHRHMMADDADELSTARQAKSALIMTLLFFYGPITESALKLMVCNDLSSEESVLVAYPAVRCGTSQASVAKYSAMVVFVIVSLGTPCAFTYSILMRFLEREYLRANAYQHKMDMKLAAEVASVVSPGVTVEQDDGLHERFSETTVASIRNVQAMADKVSNHHMTANPADDEEEEDEEFASYEPARDRVLDLTLVPYMHNREWFVVILLCCRLTIHSLFAFRIFITEVSGIDWRIYMVLSLIALNVVTDWAEPHRSRWQHQATIFTLNVLVFSTACDLGFASIVDESIRRDSAFQVNKNLIQGSSVGPIATRILMTAGPLLTQAIFFSGFAAKQTVLLNWEERGDVGDLSSIPFIIQVQTSTLWMCYGVLIGDISTIVPNITGVTLGLYFARWFHVRKPEVSTLPYLCAAAVVITAVALVTFASNETTRSIIMTGCFVSHVLLMSSPLATIKTVLRDKDTKSMNRCMTMFCTANSIAWVLFGWLVIHDPLQVIVNGTGLAASVVQVFLLWKYPLAAVPGNEDIKEEDKSNVRDVLDDMVEVMRVQHALGERSSFTDDNDGTFENDTTPRSFRGRRRAQKKERSSLTRNSFGRARMSRGSKVGVA